MALVDLVLSIFSASVGVASGLKDLQDWLNSRVSLEDVLAHAIEERLPDYLPRIQHLCPGGVPAFRKSDFVEAVRAANFSPTAPEQLHAMVLPLLTHAITTPGTSHSEAEFRPVFEAMLRSALRGFWKQVAQYSTASNRILLDQGVEALKGIDDIRASAFGTTQTLVVLSERLETLTDGFRRLESFARAVWREDYDRLADTAPPASHQIGETEYRNPFLLVRAEDFNHNYAKLAKLFQGSPEWDSIQSRTDNVFIEGGRGTGKSMVLRRLTIQATVAAARLVSPSALLSDLAEDYFGMYVKLTRGYYDQFRANEYVGADAASLLAQHELNIEIFDSFVDCLEWLNQQRALESTADSLAGLVRALTSLFPQAPQTASRLDDLRTSIVRFEQDQILTYFREKAFSRDTTYSGSAIDTVTFMRRLSSIFRQKLFPGKEVRLFLLIDEFETLLEVQQVALNTVMKMRLPDLSTKIAVRKDGRKTVATFTPGDPIQEPRDYVEVRLDYDVTSQRYARLLEGIAAMRLREAGYEIDDVGAYLSGRGAFEEVEQAELERELDAMWISGRRQNESPNQEFLEKYSVAATYRALNRTNRRKSFVGLDQFVLLSSGITSNFIELCKYAFYFGLSDQLPLKEQPEIPPHLQTEAAYRVSQRLFATIDGNVPQVGGVLARLITDLGAILRQRLLHHSSEPEANRLVVADLGLMSAESSSGLAQVLAGAVVWSVLHAYSAVEAFRPRNSARPPETEFVINRIYCPALQISPRARWRVNLRSEDLERLIDPARRELTFQRLMRIIGHAPGQVDPTQGALFDADTVS